MEEGRMFRVVVVGRPNVGKSSLFNRLTRSRKAIVGNEPGITRDCLSAVVSWDGKTFEVVDTGGLVPQDQSLIPRKILQQAEKAISRADIVLMVVDARAGITPLDEMLSDYLRSQGRQFILVANKVDDPRLEMDAQVFYKLGVERVFPVSAEHGLGFDALLEEILIRLGTQSCGASPMEEVRVALVGRPNVGKSSLLNRMVGQERVIVSDVPGTTRDAVDTLLQFQGHRFRLIDTAGIRRKGSTRLWAEKMSVVMARKNVDRADVVVLVMDAAEGVRKLDATIGGYADRAGASVLLVVNKWDLISKDSHTASRVEREFREKLRFLDYAPLLLVSARTGLRVFRILEMAWEAFQERRKRVPTADLNEFFRERVLPELQGAGSRRRFPVLYATQSSVSPPTFVLFTRIPGKLHFSTERFLINQLRRQYGFFATPIRIVQRTRKRRGRED